MDLDGLELDGMELEGLGLELPQPGDDSKARPEPITAMTGFA
jgi:hypothetical protein